MRAAVPHIDWQKLYEAAMLEMNPDKLLTRIGAAEQAIAQRESFVDIIRFGQLLLLATPTTGHSFRVRLLNKSTCRVLQ